MNEASQILMKARKSNKLVRLAMRKNGPKSYRRGQGALLRALVDQDGATQRELVSILGVNRSQLKDVVLKAQRSGFVTMEQSEEPKTYVVRLTDSGRAVAEKHEAANDAAAEKILSVLSAEEREQLQAISEKLILGMKEAGISGKKKGFQPRSRRRRARR